MVRAFVCLPAAAAFTLPTVAPRNANAEEPGSARRYREANPEFHRVARGTEVTWETK